MIRTGVEASFGVPAAPRATWRWVVAVTLALTAGAVSDAQVVGIGAAQQPPPVQPSVGGTEGEAQTLVASIPPQDAQLPQLPLLPDTRAPQARATFSNETEAGLVKALLALQDKSLKEAMAEVDAIIKRHPNFRLAHLMRGDLMMAKSGRPVAFAQLASLNTDAAAVAPLAEEAKVRLARYFDHPPEGFVPQELISIGAWQQYALLVDLDRSRIYVFGNKEGVPTFVTDFYVSMGKNGPAKQREGDQKTPIGVYFVTESRSKLPDFYGPGAFPISYPNEWDRVQAKSGFGIWLHGTPSDTYSRPPRATDGCVVLTNDDLRALARYVQVGYTPVVITRNTRWLSTEEWRERRDSFQAAVEGWRRDWESRDTERYLSHYSPRFRADGRDFDAWAQHKRNVGAGKTFVKVDVENLSAFEFRAQEEMISVTFEQNYQSSNLSTKLWKRQYWVREGNRWKIVYEAAV
jgi:murein L,D-transpeptidase YafK